MSYGQIHIRETNEGINCVVIQGSIETLNETLPYTTGKIIVKTREILGEALNRYPVTIHRQNGSQTRKIIRKLERELI